MCQPLVTLWCACVCRAELSCTGPAIEDTRSWCLYYCNTKLTSTVRWAAFVSLSEPYFCICGGFSSSDCWWSVPFSTEILWWLSFALFELESRGHTSTSGCFAFYFVSCFHFSLFNKGIATVVLLQSTTTAPLSSSSVQYGVKTPILCFSLSKRSMKETLYGKIHCGAATCPEVEQDFRSLLH